MVLVQQLFFLSDEIAGWIAFVLNDARYISIVYV